MSDPTGAASRPIDAYLRALHCYAPGRLREILAALGAEAPSGGDLKTAVADLLAEPGLAADQVAGLDAGPRLVLGLFNLAELDRWPVADLSRTIRALGLDPAAALGPLVERGLLVVWAGGESPADLAQVLASSEETAAVHPHPAAVAAARTVLPPGPGPPPSGPVRQVRQADGLEPILRLATLWQRVAETPLRQTQQGSLFKRDRDRLEGDPALTGAIVDALAPLPDPIGLWLDLARAVGLVVAEPGTDRVLAAPVGFWSEHAVHLPRLIAQRWLTLPHAAEPRLALLLWLAALGVDAWTPLDELAAWAAPLPASAPGRARESKFRRQLETSLLGEAYPLGLVRAAEEEPSGRRVIQLSELGRYVLGLGPPPPPAPSFETFLFVQPNFTLIAYRQGLTPALIGRLSRFARWERLGAALELKLTAEDTYRGLEGGLGPEAILETLARHSGRAVPVGVAEAIRTWSERRQRVTLRPAATLIEFLSPAELESALAHWPPAATPAASGPIRVSDRLLLIEDETSVPYERFRILGARDYRLPTEACVVVEPDGVTLTIDPGRSDLFIAAELSRLAVEQLPERGTPAAARRRFRITPSSLAAALEQGLTESQLDRWFTQRTGEGLPAAVRLLLYPLRPDAPPPSLQRLLVLTVAAAEVLDGLFQHPATALYLGDRLGPTSVVVPEPLWPGLQAALLELGITPR